MDWVFPVVSGTVLDVTAALGARVAQSRALARVQSADVSGFLNDCNGAKSALIRAKQVVKLCGASTDSVASPIYQVKAPASGYVAGPAFIYRENNSRFIAVKFSVRGRDLGSTIKEAQARVAAAQGLLHTVEPASLRTRSGPSASSPACCPLPSWPFALIGGIAALLLTGVNCSISAGVGFIALFGVATQDSVILVNKFRQNMRVGMPLVPDIKDGAESRLRPVVMMALMASLGLLPAAVSTGIGSETQKPLAIVVIGGLITVTFLSLLILPALREWVYSNRQECNRYK